MQMDGTLFVYGANRQGRPLIAFRTGQRNATRAIVILGGISDTPLSISSVPSLLQSAASSSWCLVHPVFSSQCTALLPSTLEFQVEELDLLLETLRRESQITEVTLFALNIGVQDAVTYFAKQQGRNAAMITRLVLQFGVEKSYSSGEHATAALQQISLGHGACPLPATTMTHPIAANRYLALSSDGTVLGGQDLFYHPVLELIQKESSSASASTIAAIEGKVIAATTCIEIPILFLFCLVADYTPSLETRRQISDKLQALCPNVDVTTQFFDCACDEHMVFLKGYEDAIAAAISTFLLEEDRKRKEKQESEREQLAAAEKRKRSIVFARPTSGGSQSAMKAVQQNPAGAK